MNCEMREHVEVARCFRCQGYGHVSLGCIEFSIQERSHSVNVGRGGKVRSPSWNTKRLSKDKLREHLEETSLIDELGWARSAGLFEDTVRAARRKVVAACDHSMPRRGHGRTGDSMYWWNDQLFVLRQKCPQERRRFTRSKGDPLLREAYKKAKLALRQGIKKSRRQCWKDLIREVEKDPWGLAFKIVTKRLATRRKTPGLDNPNRVKYIVRSLFFACRAVPKTGPKLLRGPARRTLHSRRTKESGWKAQGKHSAGDRRVAERDPQRGDRDIPGDPPRSR